MSLYLRSTDKLIHSFLSQSGTLRDRSLGSSQGLRLRWLTMGGSTGGSAYQLDPGKGGCTERLAMRVRDPDAQHSTSVIVDIGDEVPRTIPTIIEKPDPQNRCQVKKKPGDICHFHDTTRTLTLAFEVPSTAAGFSLLWPASDPIPPSHRRAGF